MFLNRLQQIDLKLIVQLVVAALFSGIIPLLFEPFFKSNFSPEEYGNYDLFLKLTMIFTLMMTFKTETILSSMPRKDIYTNYHRIITLSISSFLLYTIVYSLFVLLSVTPLSLTIYLALISGILFSVITISITYLLRLKHKLFVTLQKPLRRFVEALVLIAFVLFFQPSYALEISTIIGLTVSLIPILKKARLKIYSLRLNVRSQFILLKKSKSILIGEILNVVSLSFLSFFVFFKYSLNDLGMLELAFKILSIPQLLICSVLAMIIQNNIGTLVSEGKPILHNVRLFFLFLLAMSILFTGAIFLGTEFIISALFEEEWSMSTRYTILLLPHLFFFIILSPLSRVLYALIDNKAIRNWQFLKLCIILSALVFQDENIEVFLYYYGIISSVSYLTLVWFIAQSVNAYQAKILKK